MVHVACKYPQIFVVGLAISCFSLDTSMVLIKLIAQIMGILSLVLKSKNRNLSNRYSNLTKQVIMIPTYNDILNEIQ